MYNISVLHTRKLQNFLLADKLRVVPMSALLYYLIYWLSLIVILIHQQVANISWYIGLTGWFRCLTFPTVRLFGHSKLAVCVDGSPSLCVSIIYLILAQCQQTYSLSCDPSFIRPRIMWRTACDLVWWCYWHYCLKKTRGTQNISFCGVVFRYNWRPTVCKLFIFLHLSQAVINQ